jgi:hypothetical protein
MSTLTHPESDKPSKLLQTVLTATDGFNKWDIDAIIAPRALGCVPQGQTLLS